MLAADRMKDEANTIETTDDQIACLQQAEACLDSAKAVQSRYGGTEFIALFHEDLAGRGRRNWANTPLPNSRPNA